MTNRKSAASGDRSLRFLPTPRDRLILQAVYTHGRLTLKQIRRLFFRRRRRTLASPQAAGARLRRLVQLGLLEPAVVNSGHGAGPYAYGLTARGRMIIHSTSQSARRGALGPVWHQLEVAEFRVRLQEELEAHRGELTEWLGEPQLKSLIPARRVWPIPDGVAHWRLPGREGTFLLEWDRGTETLGILAAKLSRYVAYWRARGHRELVPGLGLRPRLVIVLNSAERASRFVNWLLERRRELRSTTLVSLAARALPDPLGDHWWRSDTGRFGAIHR